VKRLLLVTALVAVLLKASFLIGSNAPVTTVEQGQAQSGQTPADTSSQSRVIIQALTCRLTNVGAKFEGLAENKTGAPQPAMELQVVFKSADGQFVSTGLTYASYKPVLPNEVSPFSGYAGNNPDISYAEVAAGTATGASLPTSGVLKVPCRQEDS
jgi:hypothetical protein